MKLKPGNNTSGLAKPTYVTSPLLPCIDRLHEKLHTIWETRWVTNHGAMHGQLEARLTETLKVPGVSLFNNGAIGLLVALRALDLPDNSEVITTPFTFPATPHCITWNRLQPVFCDVDYERMTLLPRAIEAAITPNTSAILGVHVYGIPCDVEAIDEIARRHGLRVIYDAAHAFTTEYRGTAIANFGDISMFSFHATKLFNTIEGGCLAYNDPGYREKIYNLRNFGIRNEEQVADVGINGKMNEIQAAVGLLNLELLEEEKRKRREIRATYEAGLEGIEGLRVVGMPPEATDSLQYFVVRIDERAFGATRNSLYDCLKTYNVFTRRYFFPLCSEYDPYKDSSGAVAARLPNAYRLQDEVLCLPFYGALGQDTATRICEIIKGVRIQPGT